MTDDELTIVNAFHNLYALGPKDQGRIYRRTYWMGTPCSKCPLDMWIYQEILHEVLPDLIIESGTYMGGSALYLAHLCDILGKGRVVSIDVEERDRPRHPRITYVLGSSTDQATLDAIFPNGSGAERTLVVLDSDHSEAHVAKELALLSPYVSVGSYLIVEDTNVARSAPQLGKLHPRRCGSLIYGSIASLGDAGKVPSKRARRIVRDMDGQ